MKFIFSLLFISLTLSLAAQRKLESSSEILQEIKKLNVVTNVLYIAAHPDDENTRLIAWLENEKLARTAYLSLTRGDGGQNLVGTEKGDAMGVLRTQELLEARKEDGGEQFFSRVDDFGYSKTAEETFENWNKQEVLSDVVYVIRKFRPDVIITRFPPDSRAGHGHHTASAMLAEEAFKLAADKKAFPEQLKTLDVWQAKRILWNTSVWWDSQLPEKAAKAEDYIKIDIGDYNELLGLSYSEIAADSRSQHKSQGFGSARSRGTQLEYLKHTDGEQAKSDLFEGINTTWSKVESGTKVQSLLNEIISKYDVSNPAASVKDLVKLYATMQSLESNFYIPEKIESLKNIIKAAAGIKAEALADDYNYVRGDDITGKFILIQRSNLAIDLKSVYPALDTSFSQIKLEHNQPLELPFKINAKNGISHPYWLPYENYKERMSFGAEALRAKPEAGPIQYFNYTLSLFETDIEFEEPIDFKSTDRVKGELHRDVIISPSVTVTPSEKVYIFSSDQAQSISVLLEGNKQGAKGNITINVPSGWEAKPPTLDYEFSFVGEQKSISFQLFPSSDASVGEISFTVDGAPAKAVQRIEYDHIRPQIMFPKAVAKVVKMNLNKTVKNIGYVRGSGDEVAQNLGQVGFNVASFDAKDLAVMDLSLFETIIVGIRAYNTEPSMKNGNAILNEFVKQGGNVIVQYNTSRGIEEGAIGPYPFQLSRNRVTKEEAEPTFLAPKHPLLTTPNQLTKNDFDGWVQERGLYFADKWDEKYTPIIAWNDPGEEPQKGSILVADYGSGHFIFTGISFFRQLPAGVPGAYRLLTNMVSYGK